MLVVKRYSECGECIQSAFLNLRSNALDVLNWRHGYAFRLADKEETQNRKCIYQNFVSKKPSGEYTVTVFT